MRMTILPAAVSLPLVLFLPAPSLPRDLTFEERVRAQTAIERVYYAHQVGATRPFEVAVPRALLESKVRAYLQRTVALERFWGTRVTAEMLRREAERIAGATRLPERLYELYHALGDDPVLIQECYLRSVLVGRLTRSFFAADERIHAAARAQAEALRADLLSGRTGLHAEDPRRQVETIARGHTSAAWRERHGRRAAPMPIGGRNGRERRRPLAPARIGEVGPVVAEEDSFAIRVMLEEDADVTVIATWRVDKVRWEDWWESVRDDLPADAVGTVADLATAPAAPALTSTCDPAGVWDNGILDDPPPPPTARGGHTAVWTGSEMILWGGALTSAGDRYDPVTDTWRGSSGTNAPSPRVDHTAVWTGSKMIVWGGHGSDGIPVNSGGVYDPVGDTWTITSPDNAPSARGYHTAVWTGTEMIVWGGESSLNTGGRYNPATDRWSPTATPGALSGRAFHTAVWTGSRMIVWGGYGSGVLDTGGLYDPVGNSWTATPTAGAPVAREWPTSVWTGSEMIVWGGLDSDHQWLSSGSRYHAASNSWEATPDAGAPEARWRQTAVWTETAMIVWGGEGASGFLRSGGLYSPATNTWSQTATSGAPLHRSVHTAVWAGSRMIVWGGGQLSWTDSGGRYDPSTDSWTPTLRTSFGAKAGVWTGNEVLVWDGARGRRYSPLADAWTDMSKVDQPPARSNHAAVWSGDEMIVWGGYPTTTGGRYDPLTDSWVPTSTVDAPPARLDPTAVWTGSEMIVWGGWVWTTDLFALGSGGRYDPATDTWTPTSMTDAPPARAFHSTVWTGSEMVVWGGATYVTTINDDGEVDTGGRYDPATDTWTPTSLTDAPARRQEHTAVWTGSEMIVFGGEVNETNFGVIYRTGGRYDPVNNRWVATPFIGAPFTYRHKAVWTGSRMLVLGGSGNSAAQYDPAAGTWEPIATSGKPTSDYRSVTVWTGDMMIVWSGSATGGARYVPPAAATDADADGVRVCDGDCDDGDSAIWATPGEVLDLALSPAAGPGAAMLAWAPPASMGSLAVVYDTMRATGPDGFTGQGADCLETDDGSDTAALDPDAPPPGAVFYYLVRAENACPNGQGPLGAGSNGVARSGRSCP